MVGKRVAYVIPQFETFNQKNMNLFKSNRSKWSGLSLGALIVAASVGSASAATVIDLTPGGNQKGTINGGVFSDTFLQPAGTGVFQPFLSLDSNGQVKTVPGYPGQIEAAYNTDGFTALYMDAHRPQWNNLVRMSQLAQVSIDNTPTKYYGFILDANEPGGGKSLISIDNVRIYTRNGDNTANVGNATANLGNLGTLRYYVNDPVAGTSDGFNIDNWVKLDSSQENQWSNSNGGSGKADMILYVPVDNFIGAGADDYLFFYNLNGVHYSADKDNAAEAGFEEWRFISNGSPVPDGGMTVALLGVGLLGLGAMRRKLS
ncbi:MAG TPA: VPDSG-CTERM sorting domain-containing protein [Verrucomicrobiae bacterium]|nr:VPDSG-CTERM sorting domain-containing protein [Verrucomicrobiae bacterium]